MASESSLSNYSNKSSNSTKRKVWDHDKSGSLFLFLISLLFLYGSVRLGLGTVRNPGPGFVPFWGSVILGLSMIIHLISRLTIKSEKRMCGVPETPWADTKWRKIIYVVVGLVVYSIFFDILGFIPCTFVLMMFLFAVTEVGGWYAILTGGILTTLASYIVFEKLLAVAFPRGILGF